MAMPISNNAGIGGPAAGRIAGAGPQVFIPKDKTPLEQAEDLLDRASKELRSLRAEIERLRQAATAYEYLRHVIDMSRSAMHWDRNAEGMAVRDTSDDIEQWVKEMQERRLQGVLGDDDKQPTRK